MSQHAGNTRARIRYLADRQAPVLYIAPAAGGEIEPHRGNYVMQEVVVHNGRRREPAPELQTEGFSLLDSPSRVADYFDDREIRSIYYPEIRSLVAGHLGARRVEIFDHTRRAASDAVRRKKTVREPASIVHNDYTDESGVRRLRDFLEQHPEMPRDLADRPYAIVNVWRSIAGTVENFPLALCDAGSVSADDLVPVTRRAADRTGELQLALFSARHRWYWFPAMTEGEVVLIKTFDTRDDGRARFTLHTAFEDPGAAGTARIRESLEIRCFAFS